MHNNEDREAHAIIGGNQQGKSSLVMELVKCGRYDLRTDKIVILNSTNPKAFSELKYISERKQLERGWRGIIRYHNPAGYSETIDDIYWLAQNKYLRNGAIVFDDCTKYIPSNVPQNIKDWLVDRRMFGLDLFFTTHNLRFFPPFCRAMVNTITVFKTLETFTSSKELKNLNYPNYEALYTAWFEVMMAARTPKYIQPHRTVETGL